ncbi:outer membrane protein assembly factor BamD [Roseitranquillus sediminis]|uniref:outer membrane protein assembly factor BamD n=1 Tax=Roseitranquillus sediminis TaxID=2809051 RepID=UPI001D0C4C93|nr:outer membrane protein assembly factor BamD [Roseitranquillus sediminis]MBM9594612.1 outer membrane protein assembly factor BamD [Roseitranquillus sediminis]
MKRVWLLIGALAVSASVAGCSRLPNPFVSREQPLENQPAEQIFQQAELELAQNDPDDAARLFGEIERLYPYSSYAKRALVMQAYAYHRERDYDASRATAQRFIDLYPADEDAAYAQYLLALSYYDQIDDVGRDQGLTFQALQALREVIEVYPESEYARSAILKFDLAFDHLAAKEMEIGRYYLKRGHYVAAINRFRIVVEDFQTTTHTPEALHRLVEAYLSLGLEDEARTAGAILGLNFRGTEWYQDSYALLTGRGLTLEPAGEGFLSDIYRQVVRGEWL